VYASGSISRATIVELLANMAREVELTASVVERVLKEKGMGFPVLDKMSRQDVRMLKDKAETFRRRLLEYMANGRVEVVGFREFYVSIALSIESSALKLDAGIFRLLLLSKVSGEIPDHIKDLYLSLLGRIRDAAGYLTDLIRLIASVYNRDQRRRISDLEAKISQVESDADSDYRNAISSVIETYSADAKSLLLAKEAADYLEGAVDALYNAGNYAAIVARTEA
jgi:uncharacterized protein Yka (UPF0111/DUF47 family)